LLRIQNPLSEPWEFDEATEKELAAIAEDRSLSDRDRVLKLSDGLIRAKVKNAHPITRLLMRGVIADAVKQRSLYSLTLGKLFSKFFGKAGVHSNPFFNRVGGVSDVEAVDIGFVTIHELTHALDRNINPILFFARSSAGVIGEGRLGAV